MSHIIYMCKGCETGSTIYFVYSRKLESLTVCRSLYKGSTLSSVISRPWVLVQLGLELAASHLADQHLFNWANCSYHKNSEKKPRGLYFSKALFERLIFGGAYIRRGLSTEGNLRFKIDWASLIVGRKFTVFALFYFVFEGNSKYKLPGGLIFGGAI